MATTDAAGGNWLGTLTKGIGSTIGGGVGGLASGLGAGLGEITGAFGITPGQALGTYFEMEQAKENQKAALKLAEEQTRQAALLAAASQPATTSNPAPQGTYSFAAAPAKDNTMLYVGIGGAALLLLMMMKK